MALLNDVVINIKLNKGSFDSDIRRVESELNSLGRTAGTSVATATRSLSSFGSLLKSVANNLRNTNNTINVSFQSTIRSIGSGLSSLARMATNAFGSMRRGLKSFIDDFSIRFGSAFATVNFGLTRLADQFNAVFGLMKRVVYATFASMAIFAVYNFFNKIKEQFDELAQNIKEITVMLNPVKSEVNSLADDIVQRLREISVTTGISLKELSGAIQQIVSVGYSVDEAITIAYNAAKMAMTSADKDIESAVDSILRTMNFYGDETASLTRLLDKQFAAIKYGAFSVTEFSRAIGNVLPLAKTAGVTLEEALAIFAIVSRGQKADEAATSVKNFFSDFIQAYQDTIERAKKKTGEFSVGGILIKNEEGHLKTFTEFVEEIVKKYRELDEEGRLALEESLNLKIRSLPAFQALMNNVEEYKQLLDELTVSENQFAEAYETAALSRAALIDRIKAGFEALASSLSDVIFVKAQPILQNLEIYLRGVSVLLGNISTMKTADTSDIFKVLTLSLINFVKTTINSLPLASRALINFVSGFVVFGVVFKIFSTFVSVIGNVANIFMNFAKFMFTPIGLLVGGISLLYMAWKWNWFGIRDLLENVDLTEGILKVKEAIEKLIGTFDKLQKESIDEFKKKIEEINKSDMSDLEKKAEKTAAAVRLLLDTFTNFVNAVSTAIIPGFNTEEFDASMDRINQSLADSVAEVIKAQNAWDRFKATIHLTSEVLRYPFRLFIEWADAVGFGEFDKMTDEQKKDLATKLSTWAAGLITFVATGNVMTATLATLLVFGIHLADELFQTEGDTKEKLKMAMEEFTSTFEFPIKLLIAGFKPVEDMTEWEKTLVSALSGAFATVSVITKNPLMIAISAIYLGIKGFQELNELDVSTIKSTFEGVFNGIGNLLIAAGLLSEVGLGKNGKLLFYIGAGLKFFFDEIIPNMSDGVGKAIANTLNKLLSVALFSYSVLTGNVGMILVTSGLFLKDIVSDASVFGSPETIVGTIATTAAVGMITLAATGNAKYAGIAAALALQAISLGEGLKKGFADQVYTVLTGAQLGIMVFKASQLSGLTGGASVAVGIAAALAFTAAGISVQKGTLLSSILSAVRDAIGGLFFGLLTASQLGLTTGAGLVIGIAAALVILGAKWISENERVKAQEQLEAQFKVKGITSGTATSLLSIISDSGKVAQLYVNSFTKDTFLKTLESLGIINIKDLTEEEKKGLEGLREIVLKKFNEKLSDVKSKIGSYLSGSSFDDVVEFILEGTTSDVYGEAVLNKKVAHRTAVTFSDFDKFKKSAAITSFVNDIKTGVVKSENVVSNIMSNKLYEQLGINYGKSLGQEVNMKALTSILSELFDQYKKILETYAKQTLSTLSSTAVNDFVKNMLADFIYNNKYGTNFFDAVLMLLQEKDTTSENVGIKLAELFRKRIETQLSTLKTFENDINLAILNAVGEAFDSTNLKRVGFAEGGYTANVGTNVAAGIVHGGEWVAPAWMVKDPVMGTIITLLEKYRSSKSTKSGNIFDGFANGEVVPTVPGSVTNALNNQADSTKQLANSIDDIKKRIEELDKQIEESTEKITKGLLIEFPEKPEDMSTAEFIMKTINDFSQSYMTDIIKGYEKAAGLKPDTGDFMKNVKSTSPTGEFELGTAAKEIGREVLITLQDAFGTLSPIIESIVGIVTQTLVETFSAKLEVNFDEQEFENLLNLIKERMELYTDELNTQLEELQKQTEESTQQLEQISANIDKITYAEIQLLNKFTQFFTQSNPGIALLRDLSKTQEIPDYALMNISTMFTKLGEGVAKTLNEFGELGNTVAVLTSDIINALVPFDELTKLLSQLVGVVRSVIIAMSLYQLATDFGNTVEKVKNVINNFGSLLEKSVSVTKGYIAAYQGLPDEQKATTSIEEYIKNSFGKDLMDSSTQLGSTFGALVAEAGSLLTTLGLINLAFMAIQPIIEGFLEVVQPILDVIFKPFANILKEVGRVLGSLGVIVGAVLMVLNPILLLLRPLAYVLSVIVATIGWAADQIVLFLDAFVRAIHNIPIIGPMIASNGFLSEEQKRMMSRSIQQRIDETMGETGEEEEESGSGLSVSAHEVHNHVNIYLEKNYLLTSDDQAIKVLGDAIWQYLKPKLQG